MTEYEEKVCRDGEEDSICLKNKIERNLSDQAKTKTCIQSAKWRSEDILELLERT